jgi:DNA modification methylase
MELILQGDSYKYNWKEVTDEFPVVHVITDPPYDDRIQVYGLVSNIVKNGNILLFAPFDGGYGMIPDETLLWIKAFRTMNFTKRCGTHSFVEKIDIYRRSPVFNVLHWQQMAGVYHDLQEERRLIHPFQKPLSLIRRLVLIYTNPGDLVVDPFGGSGTTALACKQTGRNFVSMEIDVDICSQSLFRVRHTL